MGGAEVADPAGVAGLLLAAGAGTRMGRPKALLTVPGEDGTPEPLLHRAVRALAGGGCDRVVVVVGAAAADVRALLAGPASAVPLTVVEAPDWADGMASSLRAGLDALAATDAVAALVSLVDLPDLGAAVVSRVAGAVAARPQGEAARALARAAYGGRPGHPVLLGRDHWEPVARSARGDRGARDYLATHAHDVVECGDLASGRDADTPADLVP